MLTVTLEVSNSKRSKREDESSLTMTRSYSLSCLCIACLVLQNAWNIAAFQVVVPLSSAGAALARRRHPSSLAAMMPPIAPAFVNPASTTTSLLIADETTDPADVIMEKAFQDSVDFFDFSGPLGTIAIVTAVAFVLLYAFATLTGKVDIAVELVLNEFETTLKEEFPQRWDTISVQLEGLLDEERKIKLASIMNQMREEEPEFMRRLERKMAENIADELPK